jgi:hypothetical protein
MRLLAIIALCAAAALAQPPNYQNQPSMALKVGSITATALASPAATPTITPVCFSGCSHTWSYVVADNLPDGTSNAGSATGSATAGPVFLNATQFNMISHVCAANASSWTVWRTVTGAGPPTSTGKAAVSTNIGCLASVNDYGWTGDSTTAPTVNSTGMVNAAGGTVTGGFISAGTKPTVTGCGTIATQVGGAIYGTFTSGATSCTPVLTALPAATNGYACLVSDHNVGTGASYMNLSSTATSATFPTITTTSGDVMVFSCGAY